MKTSQYAVVVQTIIDLMQVANVANSDSPDRQAWQRADDCLSAEGHLYHHLRESLRCVAGTEFVDSLAEGEPRWDLADRA